jgi:hypothetical protein
MKRKNVEDLISCPWLNSTRMRKFQNFSHIKPQTFGYLQLIVADIIVKSDTNFRTSIPLEETSSITEVSVLLHLSKLSTGIIFSVWTGSMALHVTVAGTPLAAKHIKFCWWISIPDGQ